MSDTPAGERPDRLSGWKEIAAHLGKSVRSAQRWEAELDLPIERLIGPEGGQIVQASRRELDEWRQSRMRSSALDGEAADEGFDAAPEAPQIDDAVVDEDPVDSVDSPGPAVDGPALPAAAAVAAAPNVVVPARGPKIWLLALVLVAGVAAGAMGTLATIRVAGAPSRFEVHGTQIQALTEDGYPVWTHTLPRAGARPISGYGTGGRQGDLDGDGAFEAAVPITFANPWVTTAEQSDEVRIFTRSGTLRATIAPDATLLQYGRPYRGPWLFTDMAFSTSGPGRLWIAYNGVTGRPSLVVEVDRHGASRVRFVTDGAVSALSHWAVGGADRLVIGGADVTHQGAMIATLDLAGLPAAWPAASGASACPSCQWATPVAVALLPPAELMGLLSRPNAFMWRVRIAGGQAIAEGEFGVHRGAMYWFGPDLGVTAHRWLPQYQAAHRDLETQGRIDHTFEQCPDSTTPRSVRWWRRDGGWTTSQVLPTALSPAS
jgi:hypothetical protein